MADQKNLSEILKLLKYKQEAWRMGLFWNREPARQRVSVNPAKTMLRKCYRCGRESENLTKVSDGHQVCRDCLKRHYEKCDICGEYADKGEIWANGGLCELCYDEEDD